MQRKTGVLISLLPTLVAAALAATSLGACVTAQAHWPPNNAAVEIYDRTDGRILPIYTFEGRRFVVGKPGNEYAIRVRNNTGARILTVMSVDGVNAISGDTAAPSQTGYVLSPYESADIAGWRKSMSRTAAFYFTTLADSYSTRTGRPDNVGVIGVAVFREKQRPVALAEPLRKDRAQDRAQGSADSSAQNMARSERDERAKNASGGTSSGALKSSASPASAPSPMAADSVAPVAQPSLGTGYGRSESSYITYTQFERASDTPDEVITIFYDSYANLVAQGVPVAPPTLARARPDAFPDRGRFAPEPR